MAWARVTAREEDMSRRSSRKRRKRVERRREGMRAWVSEGYESHSDRNETDGGKK